MATRIAINGFGRIGRLVLRALHECRREDVHCVAINGRGHIAVSCERDPTKLPWRDLKVDVALECTGIFTKREAAAKHLEAGAKRVIVSAPADGVDITIVMG